MLHKMSLNEEYFDLIKSGQKTIEIRLNDAKRRKVMVGDTIEFTKLPDQDEFLKVIVKDLRNYKTFKEMYEDLPPSIMGCEGWSLQELMDGTYDIYSLEQEEQYGVLAIEFRLA